MNPNPKRTCNRAQRNNARFEELLNEGLSLTQAANQLAAEEQAKSGNAELRGLVLKAYLDASPLVQKVIKSLKQPKRRKRARARVSPARP